MGTVSQRLYVNFRDYCNVRLSQFLKKTPTFPTQLKFDKIFKSVCLSLINDERKNKKSLLFQASFWPRICGLSKTCSSCENFYATLRTNSDKSGDTNIYKQFESIVAVN
jgi:hypothetical protein